MFKRIALVLALACLALWPVHASAQGGPWETYMDAATAAYQQGNYPEAEKQLVAALKEAERLAPPDLPVGVSIIALAGVYDAQGRYAEAEPLYEWALANPEADIRPAHEREDTHHDRCHQGDAGSNQGVQGTEGRGS